MLLKKALLGLTDEHILKAKKEVTKLSDGTEEHLSALSRLEELTNEIYILGEAVEERDSINNQAFSSATEAALLKALKVVLSNARSAKVGTKTAIDIVAAVSAPH